MRHLLIDGYNVIHAWPELRRALEDGQDAARQRLVELARVIHDVESIRVTLVFDGRGEKLEIERPGQELNFSCLFTPAGMTADEVIEQLTYNAKNPDLITVATRDNMVAETVMACGGHSMTPDSLRDWQSTCQRHQQDKVRRTREKTDREFRNRMEF